MFRNSGGSQVRDHHKCISAGPGPGNCHLPDDGLLTDTSLLGKAQAFASKPTVGLVEGKQTQVGIIRHNDLRKCRISD